MNLCPKFNSSQPQHKPLPPSILFRSLIAAICHSSSQSVILTFSFSFLPNQIMGPADSASLMLFIPLIVVYPSGHCLVNAWSHRLVSHFSLNLSCTQQTELSLYCCIPLVKTCGNQQRSPNENEHRLFMQRFAVKSQ